MNNKINELKGELEESKNSQGNIQNIIVSAQRFADQIVEEAKAKSEEIIASAQASIEKITEQEKELTNAFDKKAGERKSALESDIEKIITNAEKKQNAVQAATQDCIDRQQLLFDKMKIEIAAFKSEITAKYKAHLELLASLPDAVPSDPAAIAAAVALSFDKLPTVEDYVKAPQDYDLSDIAEEADENEVVELEEPAEKLIQAATGFVINADEFDLGEETSEEE